MDHQLNCVNLHRIPTLIAFHNSKLTLGYARTILWDLQTKLFPGSPPSEPTGPWTNIFVNKTSLPQYTDSQAQFLKWTQEKNK